MVLHVDSAKQNAFFEKINSYPTEKIMRIGDAYRKKCDTAIAIYSIANRRYNDNMSDKEKAIFVICYMNTGDLYYNIGNYTSAFDLYIQSLKICESIHSEKYLPALYTKIGTIYCTYQDFDTGIMYYENAFNLCKKYKDKDREFKLATNLAGAYNILHNIPKAKKYYSIAKKLTNPNDKLNVYLNYMNLGFIQNNENQHAEAAKTFRHSLDIIKGIKAEPRYVCSTYEELYTTYIALHNDDSTLYYLNLCKQMAEKNHTVDILIPCIKAYSDFYERKGDVSKSLNYKGRYLAMKDSVFYNREYNHIRHTLAIYEMDKNNKKIASLNAEKEKDVQRIHRQRIVLFSILLVVIVVSGLLIVVYRQNRKLSLAYKNLFNVNQEITEAEKYSKQQRKQLEEKLEIAQQYMPKEITVQEKKDEPEIDDKKDEEASKYQASNIPDEQKSMLVEAINKVMDTTYEYCSVDFSLGKLALLTNSNFRYVSQIINETYHKNFNNFVNEYRIREARVRLMDTDKYGQYTIKAIAESLGYKSTTTFTNAFRSITGFTPSAFQKMAMKKSKEE
jgi:AraC-like DNA-binding protein